MITRISGLLAAVVILAIAGPLWAGDGQLDVNKRDRFYELADWDGDQWIFGHPGYILKSSDKGSTWQHVSSPSNLAIYAFAPVNDKVAVVCGHTGLLMRTEDGGKTWVTVDSKVKVPLFDISAAPNSTKLWAVGHFNTILHSSDAGKTWSPQKYVLPEDAEDEPGLNAVEFLDESTGFAVGEFGTIIKTTDGGKNWTQQKTINPLPFYDLHFWDANRGILVGSKGVIAATADGGASWKLWKTKMDRHLFALRPVGDEAVAVGIDGFFLRFDTTPVFAAAKELSDAEAAKPASAIDETADEDHGDAEPELPPFFSEPVWTGIYTWLNSVQFKDASLGFAVGGRGTILKTTDGGKTWSTIAGR